MSVSRADAPSGRSFQEFFRTEAAGGALLVACACLALVLANSGLSDSYHQFWDAPLSIAVGARPMTMSLHAWINDGLMAVFFLLVGLEIKREALAGELSSGPQAALPIAGAIGGMLVPALIYAGINGGGPAAHGWAIPMATDIAFALGVLSLVAPHAPTGLKVFLAALAIVDDMGAVLVIAMFYSGALVWASLLLAAAAMAVLVGLNLLRVNHLAPYLLVGVALWYFVHDSGIHATIAGVLLAFTIPTRTRIDASEYSTEARRLLDEFDRTETGDLLTLTSKGQQDAIIGLERASERVTAPLLRLEHALHGLAAFIIMPIFALSNAGVVLGTGASTTVVVGVLGGLAIGKPVGITVAAWLAVRAGLATLPAGVSWHALHGVAWLGGIGFTMSLFITNLAFEDVALVGAAKLGILASSVVAGLVGAAWIRLATRPVAG